MSWGLGVGFARYMNFDQPTSEEEGIKKAKIEIEEVFAGFIPVGFKDDPVAYFEREGANIKEGETKYDETGKVREDPTAVKDLPVWRNRAGVELETVAKRVNLEKGETGKSEDPFYEFKILELLRELGLPSASPIAKVGSGTDHLIVMEKVPGLRWTEKDFVKLRKLGYSEEDMQDLKEQAEEQMSRLEFQFKDAGIIRGWKLKDMIFDIDLKNKKVNKITPIDWERTKVDHQKVEQYLTDMKK